MKLQRRHLTTLLNAYYDDNLSTISVQHPSQEIGELIRIELGDYEASTIRFTTGPLAFEEHREELERQHDERIVADLPGPEHYMRALVGGGLLDLDNQNDVREFVQRHGYSDLEAGHHPVFAGIDTNLFPWQPESLLGISKEDGNRDEKGRLPVNGFALSAGVKSELDFYFRHHDTARLADAFGDEFNRLKNQPTSGNRQGLLGLYAYRNLLASRTVDIVPGEEGDEEIVSSYARYQTNDRNEVILFSNDYGFIELAHNHGLNAQHVSFPVDSPRSAEASWEAIIDTLYLLSVIFGVLVLPKVTLYGVWEGKDGRDWQNEVIDLDCRSPIYEESLKRRMNIVSAFESS